MRARLMIVIVAGVAMSAGVHTQQPLTVRGEIVEVSCYTKLGIEKSTGAAHIACAKECAGKGQPLAILTDGDGLLKITGDYAAGQVREAASVCRPAGRSDRHARSLSRLLARDQGDEARASRSQVIPQLLKFLSS